jgi:hypothetical protein
MTAKAENPSPQARCAESRELGERPCGRGNEGAIAGGAIHRPRRTPRGGGEGCSLRRAATAASAAAAPSVTLAPPAAAANVVPPAPAMDWDFIARNQVVERYLSGRLPLKAATEFERFCRDHAELLDQIGLPERVNAGLRLLEAAGKPEPWQEAPRRAWQKVTLVLAVAVVVLGMALAGVAASNSSKSHRIAELQKQNSERALQPATSTREIRLLPSRSGASNSPAITIGGGAGALRSTAPRSVPATTS